MESTDYIVKLRNNFTIGTGEYCDYLDTNDPAQFANLTTYIDLYSKALSALNYELIYSFELHEERGTAPFKPQNNEEERGDVVRTSEPQNNEEEKISNNTDAMFFITIEEAYLYKVNQFIIAHKHNNQANCYELFLKGRYCTDKTIAHVARYMKYHLYRNAIRQIIILQGDKEKNIDAYATRVINQYISDQEYIARLRTGSLVGILPIEKLTI